MSSAEAGDWGFAVSLDAMCFNPDLGCTYGQRRRRLHEEPCRGYLKTKVSEERKSVVWAEQWSM